MSSEHVDVLIVGAGISGIDAGYRLQERCPGKTFAILEGRGAIGGTWDLFRFPGIRSDSDMYTLCFPFRPWEGAQMIVDGTSIREYVVDTAREYGLDQKIRFSRRVVRAAWSSSEACWTVEIERTDTGETEWMTCGFLLACTGYYRYDQAYTPEFPGIERFRGRVVHPQFWTEDIEYADKRAVVIGSGATAVTIVPPLAERAGHVTMLQRSPTYVVSMPGRDPVIGLAGRLLPLRLIYPIFRWRNTRFQTSVWFLSKRWPGLVRWIMRKLAERKLPAGYDLDTHFNPRYNPWDQRPCVVPDGDLFNSIASGRASIVTDQIETFTETGIRLASGKELDADLIITATGLNLQPLGGMTLTVDGDDVDISQTYLYRGSMMSGVPNLAFAFGFVNQSWTLGADLTIRRVCRFINHMDAHGYDVVRPRQPGDMSSVPIWELTSGYVKRDGGLFPKQGADEPWYRPQSYPRDRRSLDRSLADDPALEFTRVKHGAREPSEIAA